MENHPPIIVSSLDSARLTALLESPAYSNLPGIDALHSELDRAAVVEPDKVPPGVVTMNSTVRFAMLPSGTERRLKLVYPGKSDASEDSISILAPVGSALLGLAEGDDIHWPNPNGGTLHLVVHEVEDQPERAGHYDL